MFSKSSLNNPAKMLKMLMIERDLSVKELAHRSRVSERSIVNLRNGIVKTPQIETAYRIAGALRVNVSDIWKTL